MYVSSLTPTQPQQAVLIKQAAFQARPALKVLDQDVFEFSGSASVPFGASPEIKKEYIVTNRGTETLKYFYPAGTLDNLEGKKVLDIGCGGGKFIKELDKKGIEVVGIDLADPWNALDCPESSSNLVIDRDDIARGLFKYADVTKMPFDDKSFDVAFSCLSVFFEDYENPDLQIKALTEVKRVLKPSGQLYLFGRNSNLQDIVDQVGGLKLKVIDKERFIIIRDDKIAAKPKTVVSEEPASFLQRLKARLRKSKNVA